MDKKYADILIANNICANWFMSEAKNAPAELMKFALTSGKIKDNSISNKTRTEFLIPGKVIVFSNDGNFSYVWMKGPSQTGNISGKWKIENSTLILELTDDAHPFVYAKSSELRYEVVNITNLAATSLKFKGKSYPTITNIIPSSDNPIKDFEKLASGIETTLTP